MQRVEQDGYQQAQGEHGSRQPPLACVAHRAEGQANNAGEKSVVEAKQDAAQPELGDKFLWIFEKEQQVLGHREAKADQRTVDDTIERAVELLAGKKEQRYKRSRLDRFLDERCERPGIG